MYITNTSKLKKKDLLPASRGANVMTFTPSWASQWKMEALSDNSWTNSLI